MAGNVKHLDTGSFNDTIQAYETYIARFEEIVRAVNNTAATMVGHWEGKGRDAFEKDCRTVQMNLKDISEIMYDLRDALTDAHADYMESDSALSKSFES